MNIKQQILPYKIGVRTGKKLTSLKGLIIHWIGASQPSANIIYNNFKTSTTGAHYIIDYNSGDIIHCVPDDEICYHVGANSYTKLKEDICGKSNPNNYFVGIECCVSTDKIPNDYDNKIKYPNLGKPSNIQYGCLVDFCAYFLENHNLTVNQLYRHYDITGKSCHLWFKNYENEWNLFKEKVKNKMENKSTNSKATIENALDYLCKEKVINTPDYWIENYSKIKYLDELIINFATKLGCKFEKPIEDTNPQNSKYYIENGIHFVEIPINKFKIKYWDKPKKTTDIKNYFNLGYFAKEASGKTIPIGNLVIDGKVYSEAKTNTSWINLSKKKVSTLFVTNDNKAYVSITDGNEKNIKYAISGAPIIINGKDISWSKDVVPQGWGSDITRSTAHSLIGLKNGKLFYIGLSTMSANCIQSSEIYNKLKQYGFNDVLKLDGGGSCVLDNNGKNVLVTSENRRINTIGMY